MHKFNKGILSPNLASIVFCGKTEIVGCDGNCSKAWGHHSRPHRNPGSYSKGCFYLADEELGTAPINPGTYEGEDGKPLSAEEFPNKWCVRECERCAFII